MTVLEETNRNIKSPEQEKFIDIELLHIDQQKFAAFIAACKKNGVSAHEVIEDFLDDYTVKVFGNNINYSEICMEHEDRIEEY
jgi:hypothetical protein